MRFTIPIPVVNKTREYRAAKSKSGRIFFYTTSKAKKFEESLAWYVKANVLVKHTGGVRVRVWMSGRLDADAVKGILDGIELSGRIENDRQVKHLEVFKTPGKNTSFDLEIEAIALVA